jgi:hypothetical protein
VIDKIIVTVEAATEKAFDVSLGAIGGTIAFIFASSQKTATEDQDTIHRDFSEKKDSAEPEPAAAAGGSGKGLPPGANKLRGGQGYRDKDGNIWKKDQLHKDHWDVTDRKGNKVKEVTFDGRQLWPNGPKNNQ